jgi:hypothetical protein
MASIPVFERVSEYVGHAATKEYRPISVGTGDAKAQCTREVKPEPLPEFSGDRCDGHCDMCWWVEQRKGSANEWRAARCPLLGRVVQTQTVPKENDYIIGS